MADDLTAMSRARCMGSGRLLEGGCESQQEEGNIRARYLCSTEQQGGGGSFEEAEGERGARCLYSGKARTCAPYVGRQVAEE
jgi:hypothetical protein